MARTKKHKLNKKGELKKSRNLLKKAALVAGLTPVGAAIAWTTKKDNRKKMVSFLKKQSPALAAKLADKPEALAAATYAAVKNKMSELSGGQDIDSLPPEEIEALEAQVLETEEMDETTGSGESENFLDPATLTAAKAVGEKVLGAMKKKRGASGKGWFGKKLDKDGNVISDGKKGIASEISDALKEGADTLEKEKTKAAVKEKTPVIIIAAVVILAIGAGLAIAMSKKK